MSNMKDIATDVQERLTNYMESKRHIGPEDIAKMLLLHGIKDPRIEAYTNLFFVKCYENVTYEEMRREAISYAEHNHGHLSHADLIALLAMHNVDDLKTKTFVETVLEKCGFREIADDLVKNRYWEALCKCDDISELRMEAKVRMTEEMIRKIRNGDIFGVDKKE